MTASTEHTFPGSQALQLLDVVKRWGVTSAALLDGSGFQEAQLELPATRIPAVAMTRMTERARMLTGEPGLGFYLGLQKQITSYGYVGFAAMSASTLGEALQVFSRYSKVVTEALSMSLIESGDEAALVMESHVDLGSSTDVAVFSLLVGARTLGEAMTGRRIEHTAIDVPLRRPHYFERFGHLLPRARFDMPRAALRFKSCDLELPLKSPDRAAMRLAQQSCERELTRLGANGTLSARVRSIVVTSAQIPSAEDIARAIGASTRTLTRRLAEEGLTYSALIDDERKARSLELLREDQLSIDEVAERLAYSTKANLSRAFRRWTGETPGQYRRRHTKRLSGTGA